MTYEELNAFLKETIDQVHRKYKQVDFLGFDEGSDKFSIWVGDFSRSILIPPEMLNDPLTARRIIVEYIESNLPEWNRKTGL